MPNVADANTIYLGYPIWWGIAPRMVLTFLDAAEAGTCSVPRDMPEDEMPPEMAAIKRKCHV